MIVSLISVFYIAGTDFGQETIHSISKLGYIGSFFAGIFFVSTFTVAPASIVLFKLGQIYNPLLIALMAWLGAVVGDYIIFRFLKDHVFEEIKPIFVKLFGKNFQNYYTRLIFIGLHLFLEP